MFAECRRAAKEAGRDPEDIVLVAEAAPATVERPSGCAMGGSIQEGTGAPGGPRDGPPGACSLG